jgi:NAD dependent epimerase/dehydratase family
MTAKLVDTCAKASVSRLVFASSNHVMGGYKDTPVALSDGGLSTDLPPLVGTRVRTSEGLIDSTAYAAAKLMGERVVAAKAEAGAFSAISLRIGWRQPGENIPQTISAAGTPKSGLFETDPEREHDLRWFRAMWPSNGDLIRCVLAALRAQASAWPTQATVVNAMSANRPSPWDLSAGRKLIGYEPLDDVSRYAAPDRPCGPRRLKESHETRDGPCRTVRQHFVGRAGGGLHSYRPEARDRSARRSQVEKGMLWD